LIVVLEAGCRLVVGGPYAFGNGKFEGTRFLRVLPVSLSGPFGLKWAGKGKSRALRPVDTSHTIVKGVSSGEKSRAFWRHFATPKESSEVVLNAGASPP